MIVIAYNKNERLCVITPNTPNRKPDNMSELEYENRFALLIADKDVPYGVMYKLINPEDLPPRSERESWAVEITEQNKDGVGLNQEEFNTKYPGIKLEVVL